VPAAEKNHHRRTVPYAVVIKNLCATDAAMILKTNLLPISGFFNFIC